ncbi:MAG: DUF2950 family protein [Planctomycetota bacterium]|jgi:hypothetical protein
MADQSGESKKGCMSIGRIFVVLLLLGVVGAAVYFTVWPLLSSGPHPISRAETSAVGRLRTYLSAQAIYRREDRDGDGKPEYAKPYPLLRDRNGPGGLPLNLISAEFAAARGPEGRPLDGYRFSDAVRLGGEPVDWSRDCGLCAAPAVYGKTGVRTFIVATDGTVWGKDLGGSEFVKDLPADPAADGWEAAD